MRCAIFSGGDSNDNCRADAQIVQISYVATVPWRKYGHCWILAIGAQVDKKTRPHIDINMESINQKPLTPLTSLTLLSSAYKYKKLEASTLLSSHILSEDFRASDPSKKKTEQLCFYLEGHSLDVDLSRMDEDDCRKI